MSIEKILPQTNGAVSTQRPSRSPSLGADQRAVVAKAPIPTHPSALDAVRISSTAKEMLQAAQGSPDDETFDRDKVEQIRREIAEGRFVIDEDRVARKFRELEEQLGDLG